MDFLHIVLCYSFLSCVFNKTNDITVVFLRFTETVILAVYISLLAATANDEKTLIFVSYDSTFSPPYASPPLQ